MAAADAIQAANERVAPLLAPIDGGVGVDVTYDAAFERIKSETDKLQAIAGGKPDWGVVIASCDELLSTTTKDFRVAIYCAAAKAATDGLAGLLDGFVLVQRLDETFWEAMHPALKRPRQRGSLTEWLGALVTPVIEAHRPVAKDADLVNAIDEVVQALDADLRAKLGDAYTGLAGVLGAVRNLVSALPKEAPPPPPPREAEVAAGPTTGPVDPPLAGIDGRAIMDPDSATSAIADVSLVLARAAKVLREADATAAAPYRLLRQGIWLELSHAPPAEEGTTFVPAPPAGARGQLESMGDAAEWPGLLEAAEEAAVAHPLWLDPHRFAATALEHMGDAYADACAAVVREVGALVARVPALVALAFNDGTPLADATTRQWVEATAAASGQPAGGGATASPLDLALVAARGAAADGRLDEALSSLSVVVERAPTASERFRGRLGMARLSIAAEQWAVARAQLEALEKQASRHRLIDWEPGLCAELYRSLFSVLRVLNASDATPQQLARQRDVFARLCQLDPGAAVRLLAGP